MSIKIPELTNFDEALGRNKVIDNFGNQRVYQESNSDINFMSFCNFDRAWKTAEWLSKAKCIPQEFWGNPSDILIVVQSGHELGLSPMVSLQNMMIVNNRPSIWGDAMLAVCMKTKGMKGGFIDCIEAYNKETGEWSCTALRDGREPITRTFDDNDAGALLKKGGSWQMNPKRMKQMRCRSFTLRDMFPDILKGIITIEEMRDVELIDKNRNFERIEKNTVETFKQNLKNKINELESSGDSSVILEKIISKDLLEEMEGV